MELTVRDLNLNAQLLGNISWGDAFYSHIYEVWQNILDDNWYQREVYYSGDDAGFDKITNITEEQAKEFLANEDCFQYEGIEENLKSFMKENWNNVKGYAEDCFGDDLIQAAEYLYNQI